MESRSKVEFTKFLLELIKDKVKLFLVESFSGDGRISTIADLLVESALKQSGSPEIGSEQNQIIQIDAKIICVG